MSTRHISRRTRAAAVGVLLATALLAGTAGSAAAPTPALPIPSDPRDLLLEPFTGKPATPKPLGSRKIPRHPFMAANDASNIHNDAYQSDAYDVAGPLGRNLQVSSTLFVAECASVTFDRRGRIVTVCVSPLGATLRVLDPTTLATIASHELPPRKVGTFSFTDFSGGGYFYLDHKDRAVVPTFTGHLLTIKVKTDSLTVVRDLDLSATTKGAGIVSALPDWKGRIWFVTDSGVVGFVKRDGTIRSRTLPHDEEIANSFAMDESGGVFIVSTHALYRFDARNGRPAPTWRKAYDRGDRVKPGQVSQGSGTTPTLVGSADQPGGGWVAITDNADPRMHVLVYKRGKNGPGAKPLCKQAVFARDRSATDNSIIAVPGGGLIVENNYGYGGPLPKSVEVRVPDTEPGLTRIDVDYRHGGCEVAWRNTKARIPSLVSKASLATGLVYSYTHPSADELPWAGLTLPVLPPDSWFFTAYDVRTGKQVWSRLTGTGLGYNNHYAPVSIGPDGTAYVGTLGGLVRIADGS